MPTDPSVIRLLAVLTVLLCAPLSAALGLRALELAGLLGAAGRRPAAARPSVRLAGAAEAAPVRPPLSARLLALGGCLLGAAVLAGCAVYAAVAAVRGQV
jgi:hypothetical protein